MYLNQEKLRETKEKIHKTVGKDITADNIAVAIHSMNPELKAITVMEDIQKIKDGINYFSRIYDSKASSNEPIIDVIEKIEMSEMDDKQKAGCFGAMHLMLDLTKQDAQEVSAFAQKPISEQKIILSNEIEEVADVIIENLKCELFKFCEKADNVTPLSEEEMLLNASAIYYASRVGDMSDEFKYPEIIGICAASNCIIINQCIETATEHIDSEDFNAAVRDAVIQFIKNIIIVAFCVFSAYFFLHELFIPIIAEGFFASGELIEAVLVVLLVGGIALSMLAGAVILPLENSDDIIYAVKLWKKKKAERSLEAISVAEVNESNQENYVSKHLQA